MINQTAKKILKALSFDGVEVEAFRHMADLKRLDPMKIFYKKIDEKIYNGVMQSRFVFSFQLKKVFVRVKKRNIIFKIKRCFCLYMAAAGLQRVSIIMKEFVPGLLMQPDNM